MGDDSGTLIEVPDTYPSKIEYDVIARLTGPSQSMEDLEPMWMEPTSSVYMFILKRNNVLEEIIIAQDGQIEFEGYYISYLLENIEEEEFEVEARRLAVINREVDIDELRYKIEVLQSVKGTEVSPQEIAQYFQCTESDVLSAMGLLTE